MSARRHRGRAANLSIDVSKLEDFSGAAARSRSSFDPFRAFSHVFVSEECARPFIVMCEELHRDPTAQLYHRMLQFEKDSETDLVHKAHSLFEELKATSPPEQVVVSVKSKIDQLEKGSQRPSEVFPEARSWLLSVLRVSSLPQLIETYQLENIMPRYGGSVTALLANTEQCLLFATFCEHIITSPAGAFYLAAEKFKLVPFNSDVMLKASRVISSRYLRPDAPSEVAFPPQIKQDSLSSSLAGKVKLGLFKRATAIALSLLRLDEVPAFLLSQGLQPPPPSELIALLLDETNVGERVLALAQSLHVEENMLLVREIQRTYIAASDSAARLNAAQQILSRFMEPGAPMEVATTKRMRQSIMKAIEAAPSTPLPDDLFDHVQRVALCILTVDLVPRLEEFYISFRKQPLLHAGEGASVSSMAAPSPTTAPRELTGPTDLGLAGESPLSPLCEPHSAPPRIERGRVEAIRAAEAAAAKASLVNTHGSGDLASGADGHSDSSTSATAASSAASTTGSTTLQLKLEPMFVGPTGSTTSLSAASDANRTRAVTLNPNHTRRGAPSSFVSKTPSTGAIGLRSSSSSGVGAGGELGKAPSSASIPSPSSDTKENSLSVSGTTDSSGPSSSNSTGSGTTDVGASSTSSGATATSANSEATVSAPKKHKGPGKPPPLIRISSRVAVSEFLSVQEDELNPKERPDRISADVGKPLSAIHESEYEGKLSKQEKAPSDEIDQTERSQQQAQQKQQQQPAPDPQEQASRQSDMDEKKGETKAVVAEDKQQKPEHRRTASNNSSDAGWEMPDLKDVVVAEFSHIAKDRARRGSLDSKRLSTNSSKRSSLTNAEPITLLVCPPSPRAGGGAGSGVGGSSSMLQDPQQQQQQGSLDSQRRSGSPTRSAHGKGSQFGSSLQVPGAAATVRPEDMLYSSTAGRRRASAMSVLASYGTTPRARETLDRLSMLFSASGEELRTRSASALPTTSRPRLYEEWEDLDPKTLEEHRKRALEDLARQFPALHQRLRRRSVSIVVDDAKSASAESASSGELVQADTEPSTPPVIVVSLPGEGEETQMEQARPPSPLRRKPPSPPVSPRSESSTSTSQQEARPQKQARIRFAADVHQADFDTQEPPIMVGPAPKAPRGSAALTPASVSGSAVDELSAVAGSITTSGSIVTIAGGPAVGSPNYRQWLAAQGKSGLLGPSIPSSGAAYRQNDDQWALHSNNPKGILKVTTREETFEEVLLRVFMERQQETERLLGILTHGEVLKKINSLQTTDKRWVQVSQDGTELWWDKVTGKGKAAHRRAKTWWRIGGETKKSRELADCQNIRYGTYYSTRFQRYNDRLKPPWLGFSMFFEDRTLDFVCKDEHQASVWFLGLQSVCPLTPDYLSMGGLLWARAKMKVEVQAEQMGIREEELWIELLNDSYRKTLRDAAKAAGRPPPDGAVLARAQHPISRALMKALKIHEYQKQQQPQQPQGMEMSSSQISLGSGSGGSTAS